MAKDLKSTQFSVFKELMESKHVPYPVTLEKVVSRLKSGKSKSKIDIIRNSEDPDIKQNTKYSLPSIVFGGIFRERNGNGLVSHSGLMVMDFDKYEDETDLKNNYNLLKKNKYICLMFISPSGNGIKAVIRVPKTLTKETHPKLFKVFEKEFNYPNFDKQNSNIDRVCFESYDPNPYVNYEAEIYEREIIDKGYSMHEKVPLVPINDEDKIIDRIMSWNFKKDFIEGERNSYIFDLAGLFCEYGVSESMAEGYILNNVVIGDFKESEAKNTIKSAYRTRGFNTKFFEDYTKIERIKLDLKKGKTEVIKKHKISDDVFDEIKEANDHDDFWVITEDAKKQKKVKIIPLKYKLFLERNGFKKYFPNEAQKPTWLFVESNKVEETSVEKIKDFVLNYLMERKELEVWNYCSTFQNLFSDNFLLMLETIELDMLRDKKDTSYIAFKNGILKVTKDGFKLIDFIDIDFYIWKSQIINRDFKEIKNFKNEYQKFINNISNNTPKPIEVVIGYLLSTYKNKMNNKAIILNDEVISDNPEGGTGKGLFVQGLKQIRKVSILDGKSFDDRKSFPYQTVSQETNVLVFDDVKKNFDFESKFSLVTEGMTLERKNKDAIKLKVEESPKMLISTNYAIKGEGNSHDRRRHEIEISQYYGKDKTPYTEFGRQLFDDWSNAEFQCFDNYMVRCLQMFLKHGLIKQEAKNIRMRKFIAESSMEFYEWISDNQNVKRNCRVIKIEAFNNFINEYQDYKKFLSRKKFNTWIQKYCSFMNYDFNDGISYGDRWFEINDPNSDESIEGIDF